MPEQIGVGARHGRTTLLRPVLLVVGLVAFFAVAIAWRVAILNSSFALQDDSLSALRLNGDLVRLQLEEQGKNHAGGDAAFERTLAALSARVARSGVRNGAAIVADLRVRHRQLERGPSAPALDAFIATSRQLASAIQARAGEGNVKTRADFVVLTSATLLAGSLIAWLLIEEPRRRMRLLEQIDAEQAIIEKIPQMVWTKDAEGRNDYCNARFLEYMNFTRDEFVNNSWIVAHPDDVERGQAVWRNAVASGTPYDTELRLAPKGVTSYRWFLVRAVPHRDASGRVVKWYGTTTDIDAQRRAMEAMDFLAQSGAQLAGAEDVATVLDRLAHASLDGLADISLFDLEGEDGSFRRLVLGSPHVSSEVMAATRAFDAPRPGEPHPIARAMVSGETIHVSDVDEDFIQRSVTPAARQDAWRLVDIRSMVCVPMMVPGRPLGALTLLRVGRSAPFENSEVKVVEEVARRAAVAIENIRLREREQRAARDLKMFADMGESISEAVGLQATIDAALRVIVPARAARATVDLADEYGRIAADRYPSDGAVEAPILAGSLRGTLRVYPAAGGEPFTPNDIAFFDEFARRIAPALANAQLFERDRNVARSFQDAALPTSLPAVPGFVFRAMYEAGKAEALVGGDWYDIFALGDGRIVISIGDVAGSGLSAAVTMAGVRQAIRGAAHVRAAPNVMLDAAHRVLGETGERFVTAFAGVIDPRSSTLTYASAGHPPPLLRLPNGDVHELAGDGTPLGVPNDAERIERSLTLPSGSLLVLYTDGLVEATRDIVDGTQRLRAALLDDAVYHADDPARLLHDRILTQGSRDDVAILTIRSG